MGPTVLYAGGAAVGGNPANLYRVSVANVSGLNDAQTPLVSANWQPIGPGSSPAFSTFSRFPHRPGQRRPGSSTRSGNGDTLWETDDGGNSWRQDQSAPAYVTNAWLSPADGALYATIRSPSSPWPIPDVSSLYLEVNQEADWSPGVLWKRTTGTGTPPGARVVEGDLRPSCTGGDGLRALAPGATFPIGTTTMTCTATDVFGNKGTQTITVTVSDTTPPALTVPGELDATAPAGGTAMISFNVTAVDTVAGDVTNTVVCTPPSGSLFPIGETVVVCTAHDQASPVNNTAQASFPVVVSQAGSPQLAIPGLTTPGDQVAEATGPSGATLPLVVNAQTGGNSPKPLTPLCMPPLSSTFPLGVTDVSCTATDGSLTATQSFRVTVKDTQAPSLIVPADVHVSAQGAWGANVTYTATATDVVDGQIVPSCAPTSGSPFPLGTTGVTCQAVDLAGNRATGHFNVTVQDRNPPVLHVADITANATDFTGTRVAFNVMATDLEDPNPVVDCLPPSGSLFPIGDTTVACTATDSTNNQSQASFVVHVVDMTAPLVTVPSTITLEASGPSGSTATFTVSAFDAVTIQLSPTCSRITNVGIPTPVVSGALFPIGDNVVTCTATDLAGNVGSSSFTIIVRDTTAPVFPSLPAITADVDGTGTATVTFYITATDTVSGVVPAGCTPKPGSRFSVGTTLVSCTVRDAAGNEASGTFTVTVRKANTPPIVTVPPDMTVEATGPGGASVTFVSTATDAQDGPLTPGCLPASGSTFALGNHTVTCTATDSGNLSGSSTFHITVVDTTPPVLKLPAPITVVAGAGGLATVNFVATATDLVSGAVVPTCTPTSGSSFAIGTATVGCFAKDAAGNQTPQGTFTVTVTNTPPVVTVPGPIVAEATGPAGAAVSFTATATDAQDGPLTPTCTSASGATFSLGTTTVTCTAVDHQSAGSSRSVHGHGT